MNTTKITDYGHYTGALRSSKDRRDKHFPHIAGSLSPFDWVKGFDVEDKLQTKLITKNQFQSFSCGGQATSYYGEVLSTLFDKIYNPKSAKFIYSQTFVSGGGSAARDNLNIVVKQGFADEKSLPSYDKNGNVFESFMERSQDITEETRVNASQDKALVYATTNTDIESVAKAIEINYGCKIGVNGSNNGTWKNLFPLPPKKGETTWAHWLYAGKAKILNGKKYIGVKNSWGNIADNGWQWLGEEYFTKGNVWEAWTILFNPNKIDQNFKHNFIQDLSLNDNSEEVRNLQRALQILGYFPAGISPTTFFGEETRKALYAFQVDYKVAPIWILWFNQGRYCFKQTRNTLNSKFNN